MTTATLDTTATALLAAIVSADEGFAEAAEAIDRGIIDQTRYQTAAERLEDAIAAAREYLDCCTGDHHKM
jgi:hypothetical protein